MLRLPRAIQLGSLQPGYYKGILMRANPTLHEEAYAILSQYCDAGDKVIDVGSGQGAFSARLTDAGYTVTAVDKNSADFRAEKVQFISVDFDSTDDVRDFLKSNRGSYDAAIGMEVIEHVENPWEYIRFLLSLVRPGGHILITTPNAASSHSRVNFLMTGVFDHFSRSDFENSGHINPLTAHELRIIAEGAGAEIVSLNDLCRQPWVIVSRRPTAILRSFLSAVIRPFMTTHAGGDILCAVLRKPKSDLQKSG